MSRIVILGTGGHARTLQALMGYPADSCILTDDDDEVRPDDSVLIGVGDVVKRRSLFKKFRSQVQEMRASRTFVHTSVKVGRGIQMIMGAMIMPNCRIGDNVLINTGAQIDHDCNISSHCVISPGAILCGNVTLGEACFIGAGAIIVQEVTLEPETFIPAGTLVVGPDDLRHPLRDVVLPSQ
ncbi:MAG TPA: hypothetical protein ENH55_13290 [Aurantimonas coralicida]|uniref:Acetyltransferase n=2 Tax=root TaxID=1 RepID=A0A9C9NDU5_9HYPH|nr:hypothetical protein [Aurantimonas coralicida]HET99665.1 hypothetical protein [Aurantimonas coralicida]